MKKILILIVLLSSPLIAQEDEYFFQNTQSVVPLSEVGEKNFSSQSTPPVTTNFSGDIFGRISYIGSRKWLDGGNTSKNLFLENFEADLYLDLRLRKNFRVFISPALLLYPQGISQPEMLKEITFDPTQFKITEENYNFISEKKFLIMVREFFFDFNIKRKIFFRLGKQVANLGTCFFWNPTNLIDIEKKEFFDVTHPREGTDLLKITWNIASWYNLYGFINFAGQRDPLLFTYTLRNEFLIKDTETGILIWSKKDLPVVWGWDISTRVLGIDLYGEATISKGDYQNKLKLNYQGFKISTPYGTTEAFKPEIERDKNQWTVRAALDLSRSFNWELPNRIITTLELFYNGGGYTEKLFSNPVVARYFLMSGLYQPNYYGKFYLGFFGTVNSIWGDNLSLMLNNITNLSDKTGIANLIFRYTPVYNMNLNFYLTGFYGPPGGEYTWQGNTLMVSLYTTVSF